MALRDGAGGIQESFVDAPEVVDRSRSLFVGHARYDEPASPGSSTTHLANRE